MFSLHWQASVQHFPQQRVKFLTRINNVITDNKLHTTPLNDNTGDDGPFQFFDITG